MAEESMPRADTSGRERGAQHSLAAHVAGGIATIFFITIAVEFLGVVVMVGAMGVSPRDAAIWLLGPALVLAVIGACVRPVRRFVAACLIFLLPFSVGSP